MSNKGRDRDGDRTRKDSEDHRRKPLGEDHKIKKRDGDFVRDSEPPPERPKKQGS